MQDHNLIDAFRHNYPDKRRYTWHKNKPIKQARLDYFLISSSLEDILTHVDIKPGYRSDHSILELSFLISKFKRGRGTWKLNTSFLKDKDFVSLVNTCIKEEYKNYAVPIYNLQYLDNMENEIELKIDYDLFLEVILLRIRGEAIKYGAIKKKMKNKRQEQLEKEIEQLELSNSISELQKLEQKKAELVEYRQKEMQGYLVRSRSQSVTEGERPTKFFCALEHKNYIDKTIKCIKRKNQTITRNQEEILQEVKDYYEELFKSRENTLIGCNFKTLLKGQNIKKITATEAKQIEGYLTVQELTEALKNTKNNKTPGLDGFPAEFFKVFWNNLKICVAKAINTSFDKGLMSTSLRQCLITCLPKQGKKRENIENWRPLSMLSVVYKLCSAAIANRIKPLLTKIIDQAQCGFVQGRYIGECTRLVYDILNQTEKLQIPGMLVLIDFRKAFDSISWSFIYNTMSFLGFSQNFLKWLKLFNTDIKATVIQSGFLSDYISIQRGCRQGDPISAYLFILAAQILTLLVKGNKRIKGIQIQDSEIKITQFADDTTLTLNGTNYSLEAALNTLEVFGSYSGLRINTDKTQIVWIGKKKHSKEKPKCNGHNWATVTNFRLLGINFSVDLEYCLELNYSEQKSVIEKCISQWNKRYLTPLGKIMVIKTFLMSKMNHLLSALPDPKETFIHEINDMFFKFIWSGKPDKINRKTLELDHTTGGMKMINLKNSIISLKATWMRRLVTNIEQDKSMWIELFELTHNTDCAKLVNFGTYYPVILKRRSQNTFWRNVFDAWIKVSNKLKIKNCHDLFSSPLWYNSEMACQEMFLPKWYEKGIVTIADVTNDLGVVMDLDTIKRLYNIDSINPLHYLRVQQNVKQYMKKHNFETVNTIMRPFVPFYATILCNNRKGANIFNRILKKESKNDHSMKQKWERDVNLNIDEDTWKISFNLCFKTVCNNSLIWFQIKLLYRVLGTRSYMHKLNLIQNGNCVDCGESETIIHMFVECLYVKRIWHSLEEAIRQTTKINLSFGLREIIFGYHINNQYKIPINAMILITKKYIFDTKLNSNTGSSTYLSFHALKHRLQQTYEDEKYLAITNNNEQKFKNMWNVWMTAVF